MTYHEPVMSREVLRHLSPPAEGIILDGTVGGGGHAWLVLSRSERCTLVAVDRDPEALDAAKRRLAAFADRVRFLHARFDEALERAAIPDASLAGIVLDLGVSSHQLDADARGFTFRPGIVLDMRMDGSSERTAADLLNTASVEELADVIHQYGEFPRARRIAREIVRRRERQPLRTSDDLVAALSKALGRSPSIKEKARAFQALRIELNDEIRILTRALPELRNALRPGAAFVVIAYHSLEDRVVKEAFREWSRACVCPPELPVCACRGQPLGETLTPKPERPSEDEVAANPRARSARLRAWRAAA